MTVFLHMSYKTSGKRFVDSQHRKSHVSYEKDRPQSVAAFLETLGNKNTKVTFENDENTISTDANYILTDNIPVRESRKKPKGIMLMLATILVLAVAIAYSVSKPGGSTGKDAPHRQSFLQKQ